MSVLVVALVSSALTGCSLRLFAPEPTPTPIATPTPARTASPFRLSVVWATGGKVYLWREGSNTALQIAETDADAPLLSADGQIITFVRNPVGGPQSLWRARLDDNSVKQVGDPLPMDGNGRTEFAQLAWADKGSLFYSTQLSLPQSMRRQYDLYNVDMTTGEVGMVLKVGLGGMMTFSPDGRQTVLMDPGQPGGSVEGSIVLFDAVALGGHIKITFPPAAQAALDPIDLPIDWQSDSRAFYVSTPAWDKALVPARDNLRVTVWRTPIDDYSRAAGVLQAHVWGMPRVSPDGARIVYLRRPLAGGAADALELVTADIDNSGAKAYATGTSDSLGAPRWLTNEQFVYRLGDDLMLGKLSREPKLLPDANPAGAPRLVGTWLIYPGKQALLVVVPLDALDQAVSLGAAVEGQPPPRFDAVIAP